MDEFNLALEEGFSDTDAIAVLVEDERITSTNRDDIRRILNNILIMGREAALRYDAEKDENEEDDDDEEGEGP
jgi:hypothetical protein